MYSTLDIQRARNHEAYTFPNPGSAGWIAGQHFGASPGITVPAIYSLSEEDCSSQYLTSIKVESTITVALERNPDKKSQRVTGL